jgi:hypothetical protein
MTTIVQYLPQWLRSRLRKPAPQKVTRPSKKDRQVLPTLPNWKQSSTAFQDDESPPGYRILWRL